MECEDSPESLLDLSHLTDEEQTTILKVLLRDAELRSLEEGRISKLRSAVTDPWVVKTLSGDWFNELRAKRHRRYGSDIVQASIRRKKKAKDIPLCVLAKSGEVTLANPLNNGTPPRPGRLGGGHDEEEGRSAEDRVNPKPSPRTKVPNGSAGSKECVREQSGQREETAEKEKKTLQNPSSTPQVETVTEKDSDSFSSTAPTEPSLSRLRAAGSTSSLHSSQTLSGSMMSLFSSGEFGAVEVRGSLQFSLHYDTKKEELQVQVFRCQDLAHARKDRSDPYVKTYLLPDKSSHSKKKTLVKKKTMNPVYDETLKYKLKMSELKGRILNLSVWHHDPLRRNIFLGEVEVGLADWDWGQSEPCWRPLLPRIQLTQDSIGSRGTILFSVKFTPAGSEGSGLPLTGELHFWLREAQGLIPTKGGSVDSFVKSYILPDESRSSRQKTRVVKGTVSPTYNHTMVYDGFQSVDLTEACAEITVWEKDALSSHLLGGVRLSSGTGQSYGQQVVWMDSSPDEVNVWTAMIQNPNTWVDAALPLRTNLAPRRE